PPFPSTLLFLIAPPTPEIYTLSLHDALPICQIGACARHNQVLTVLDDIDDVIACDRINTQARQLGVDGEVQRGRASIAVHVGDRSEEHTSELQSRENLVCRLLLEKKKNTTA